MLWVNLLGYAASASVLATFCMSTMVPLRAIAVCSNVLFAAFGALAHIYPVLLLHAILLPVNIIRLMQVLVDVKEPSAIALTSIPFGSLMGGVKPRRTKLNSTWREAKGRIAEWRQRARERRELVNLGERDCHDIGISRYDARVEAAKPFWRT